MICALPIMIPVIHLREKSVECMDFQRVEKIMDEFDSILEDLSKIKDGKVEIPQPTADSSKFVDGNKSIPVGVDEDLMQTKDRLTGSTSKLDLISIVGMGGVGTRNLYNDSLIKHHFDTRAWIVVSQEYHLREIFTGLLDSTRQADGGLHRKSIAQLAEHLYKSLKGQRYLIVMDDVWDTKSWVDVKRFFPNDNSGSRIIITTGLSKVAIYANSYSSIHHMSLLSSEASWDLLREKVLGKECCPCSLEKIGKKIAENCKGHPLAIVVIGGLLSKGSKIQAHWEYLAENVKLAVSRNVDRFMEILSLSYNDLPHHLKACFLYMAVFPQDHVIFVSKLWIAEGFVKPLTPKSLEEVAEHYLKDLIDRNLILINTRNHRGGTKTCIIYDWLRELCVRKAEDEKILQILKWGVPVSSQDGNGIR